MKANIILLILLMPFFAFTQSDLNMKKTSEIELEKNLIAEPLNNLERHINTTLINDSNHHKSDKDINLQNSYALSLNIERTTNDRLLNIIEVQNMTEMFQKFRTSIDSKRQFGKEIDLNNSSVN